MDEKKKKKLEGFEIGSLLISVILGVEIYQKYSVGVQADRLVIAAFILALGMLLFPRIYHPLFKIWMKFSVVLGKVMSPVVMTIMFFVVITPFALALRLMGKDLLRIRKDKKSHPTHWAKKRDDIEFDMRKQF